MEYPSGFDNPVFPTMRRLALARWMSVWTLVAFLVVIALCGFLMWSVHSMRANPYMIVIDPSSSEWSVISEKTERTQVPPYQVMQEYVVLNFARRWFAVSDKPNENEARWCKCDANSCDRYNMNADGKLPCLICCNSSSALYRTFTMDILPNYQARVLNGETWTLDTNSVVLHPESKPSESGGVWHMTGKIRSSISGVIEIEAFVNISKSLQSYPLTFGYYVSDFNAYKGGN